MFQHYKACGNEDLECNYTDKKWKELTQSYNKNPCINNNIFKKEVVI